MNRMVIYITTFLVGGLLLCQQVDAQRQKAKAATATTAIPSNKNKKEVVAPRSRVQYAKQYMKQEGDSLVVSMDIDMSKMKLKSNQGEIITPVISYENEEIELPRVMIQGATRHKAFLRELELDEKAFQEFENNLPYTVIVKPNGKITYRYAVQFEDWMSNASLDVEEDLCGCGDQATIARTRLMEGVSKDPVAAQPVYKVRPYGAYIQPEVEVVKRRNEVGNAYLDFPRGQSEIQPRFGNNEIELAKIDKMIRTISTNKDITVTGVFMAGYASPESSLKFNTELSNARAKSMMKYFMDKSVIPSNLFEVKNGGEDWEGLRKLLEEYPIVNKSEIMSLMNSISDLDKRESAISKVAGGRPYKIMYEELYPKLRRVVCEVAYTVKEFSLEEAKENLAIAPQLLSLNEMYIVANTYETGSPEFLKAFEIARQEFPDDPVANLNSAAVALTKGNIRDAEKYLALADPSTPEYANNMGALKMLKGDYREAERLLKQAESAGIEAATANIRELRKKLANVNSRREAGVSEEKDDAPATDANTTTTTNKRKK